MPKQQEAREIIRRLRKEGWSERKGKGSHLVFLKDGVVISVPTSRKEVAKGTYETIRKAAGWK